MNYLSNNGSVWFCKFPLSVAYVASEILVWIIPSRTELFCKRERERFKRDTIKSFHLSFNNSISLNKQLSFTFFKVMVS